MVAERNLVDLIRLETSGSPTPIEPDDFYFLHTSRPERKEPILQLFLRDLRGTHGVITREEEMSIAQNMEYAYRDLLFYQLNNYIPIVLEYFEEKLSFTLTKKDNETLNRTDYSYLIKTHPFRKYKELRAAFEKHSISLDFLCNNLFQLLYFTQLSGTKDKRVYSRYTREIILDCARTILNEYKDHDPLREKLQSAEEKRNILIESHLLLALKIARKNFSRVKDPMEVIVAAYDGLMIAVNKFDHHKGNRLYTLARWYILSQISLNRKRSSQHLFFLQEPNSPHDERSREKLIASKEDRPDQIFLNRERDNNLSVAYDLFLNHFSSTTRARITEMVTDYDGNQNAYTQSKGWLRQVINNPIRTAKKKLETNPTFIQLREKLFE